MRKDCKIPSKEWLYREHIINRRLLKDIALDVGVSKGTLSEYFKKHGIVTINFKRYENIPTKVVELIENKDWLLEQHHTKRKSVRTISKELNISEQLLRKNFIKFKIKIRCYNAQENISLETLNKLNDKNWLLSQHLELQKPAIEIAEELGDISPTTVLRYFKKNGIKTIYYYNKAIKIGKNTCLQKYGKEHPTQQHISEDNYCKLNNKIWLNEQHNILHKPITTIAQELNVTDHTIWRRFHDWNIPVQRFIQSEPEKEMQEFIKSKEINVVQNTRSIISPLELDIYLPDKNLAIEYDGLFWHSYDHLETPEEKNKHFQKTELCSQKGIQLLHILENEWSSKKEIVKSIISSKLGQYEIKLGARECQVEKISSKISRQFLIENHIQGYCQSTINLGLFHRDELVSLMTFNKPRYNKNYQWELVRFCNKINYQVHGSASKLLENFKLNQNPTTIISYADRRYSNGGLYKKLGFCYSHTSKPNYFYTTGYGDIYRREKFQKHKLSKLLKNFDPNITEAENMFNNGYRRIWDCGNLVFVYNN